MPPINRTTKIQNLHKVIKKQSPKPTKHPERSVLEHLVYAACLENASFEAADRALAILQQEFVDWNEVRVSAPSELAEVLTHLPEPLSAGERVKRVLQGIFETKYTFDLDDLSKKPQAQVVQFFDTFPSVTNFMVDYVIQSVLGSHVIPLDEAALRIFRLLGLTQLTSDQTREIVPSLERVITKGEGVAFAIMIHHVASQFYDKPDSAALRQILKSIDTEVKNRSWAPPTLAPDKRELLRQQRRERARLDMRQFTEQFESESDSPDESRVTEIDFIPNQLIDGSDQAKNSASEKGKTKKTKSEKVSKTKLAKKAKETKSPKAAVKIKNAEKKLSKKDSLKEKPKKSAGKETKIKVSKKVKAKEKFISKAKKSASQKVSGTEKKARKSVAAQKTAKTKSKPSKPAPKKLAKKTAPEKTTKKLQKKSAGKSALVTKTSKNSSSTTKLRHKKPR